MTRLRGFTLIELLVVIAIIGILSAVVLASLSTARQKGADATVESDLQGIPERAELYYQTTGNNTYGSLETNSCTPTGAPYMFSADSNIKSAIAAATSESRGMTCFACAGGSCGSGSAAYYVIQAQINGTSTQTQPVYYCVDSTNGPKFDFVIAQDNMIACP